MANPESDAVSRRYNPPSESVFFQSLLYKIVFFPFRLLNCIGWLIHRALLRIWRVKNVDIPYRKRRRR